MILHLLYKPGRYKSMVSVDRLQVTPLGITGAAPSSALRHLLIVPQSTLTEFGLRPGDLRENVVLDDAAMPALHALPSGTLMRLGQVEVRLTFHCEPCARLKEVVDTKTVLHRRGYLCTVLQGGEISIGQPTSAHGAEFDAIPYDTKDRIAWYMGNHPGPVAVTTLVHEVGLSLSYCRAIPTLLKNRQDLLARVTFRGRRLREGEVNTGESLLRSSIPHDSTNLHLEKAGDEGVVESLEFIPGAFVVYLKHDRSFTVPIRSVPTLQEADERVRQEWEVLAGGTRLRWPLIDLEVSVAELLGLNT